MVQNLNPFLLSHLWLLLLFSLHLTIWFEFLVWIFFLCVVSYIKDSIKHEVPDYCNRALHSENEYIFCELLFPGWNSPSHIVGTWNRVVETGRVNKSWHICWRYNFKNTFELKYTSHRVSGHNKFLWKIVWRIQK